ncbi:hypothetical protein UA08_07846 [Talaromyces atroroseus]|uniref:Bromo domain-containing protein n=1 Tax=Talaromyces atroroseus TaxID=1441469 RepID=A0A225AQJ9_TALAT|nr:hypothetical protein UA08_07846 [Talaromyces atroroseus]OKL56705.1 hypothetical protein UA08_07846 [Talaromyces atroroseus]
MSARRKFSSTGPVEPIPLHGSKRRKVSKRHADYYKVIALPISLDAVVGKLNSHEYATLTELESDLKRLVSNAKKYNEKGSLLFADAERIRKIVTNTMPKINPAYNDPNYVPFPTPIPDQVQTQAPSDEDADGQDQNADAEIDAEDEKSVQPSDQALEKDEQEELNFEGNTIQLAQDKIISELIHLRDEQGREVGAPFLYKPDRNLYKEYYEIIQHPVSLRGILKQVRGIEGRKPHSRKTAFPNWRSFANEMDFVWGNAREFNEDDSEIVDLAKILEAQFKRRLAEAKSVVPDPVQENVEEANPRIKLKLGSSKTPEPASQRLMLRFTGQKSSSVEDKTPASASLDGDSVQRQQEPANGDIAGQRSALSTTQESRETLDYTRLGPTAQVLGQGSPMPTSIITPSPSQTPIPSTTSADVLMHSMTGGHGQMINPWPSGNPPAQPYQSYASVESIFRRASQDVSDALIKDLAIKSHSSLGVRPKFSLHFPASPILRQQSLVVNIPASQNFLSLSVKIAPSTAEKRTKFVALFGPQKVILAPQPHSLPNELFYDIRLPLGLTKVDFQMASSIRPTGQENTTTIHAAEDTREFERLTVFFRLVR